MRKMFFSSHWLYTQISFFKLLGNTVVYSDLNDEQRKRGQIKLSKPFRNLSVKLMSPMCVCQITIILYFYIYYEREASQHWFCVTYSSLTFERALESRVMLHFTPHIKTVSSHAVDTHHVLYMHMHREGRRSQTCTHTHAHTLTDWHTHAQNQPPDHRYCALHESLSTVCGVQCIVGWNYTHAYTVPYLFIALLSPHSLSSLSTVSLIISSSLCLSLFSLSFNMKDGWEKKNLTEARLYIEHGWINEYLMLFPLLYISLTLVFSALTVWQSLAFLYPSLPPLNVHSCTFLFRRAPLVPGTASHTRLMASLEGERVDVEAKMVTTDSHMMTGILALS